MTKETGPRGEKPTATGVPKGVWIHVQLHITGNGGEKKPLKPLGRGDQERSEGVITADTKDGGKKKKSVIYQP